MPKDSAHRWDSGTRATRVLPSEWVSTPSGQPLRILEVGGISEGVCSSHCREGGERQEELCPSAALHAIRCIKLGALKERAAAASAALETLGGREGALISSLLQFLWPAAAVRASPRRTWSRHGRRALTTVAEVRQEDSVQVVPVMLHVRGFTSRGPEVCTKNLRAVTCFPLHHDSFSP